MNSQKNLKGTHKHPFLINLTICLLCIESFHMASSRTLVQEQWDRCRCHLCVFFLCVWREWGQGSLSRKGCVYVVCVSVCVCVGRGRVRMSWFCVVQVRLEPAVVGAHWLRVGTQSTGGCPVTALCINTNETRIPYNTDQSQMLKIITNTVTFLTFYVVKQFRK